MTNWMAKLATHYAQMQRKYPEDQLLIVFDIDGTMLDLRYMMLHVLQAYDRQHGADYFRHLTIAEIDVHEHRDQSEQNRRAEQRLPVAGDLQDFERRADELRAGDAL